MINNNINQLIIFLAERNLENLSLYEKYNYWVKKDNIQFKDEKEVVFALNVINNCKTFSTNMKDLLYSGREG